MRVVVADDSVLLREGLVRLLTEVDCEVLAAVEDAQLLRAVASSGRCCDRGCPDAAEYD